MTGSATTLDPTAAMTALKGAPLKVPGQTTDPTKAKAVAQQFEGVFITQMLGAMFDGIPTDGPFGGGQGEEMFRSLMVDEYGKQMASQGGFGLSDAIQRELLKVQEKAH
ncbi:MAG TPA: rod-binding protein [Rhizomicrobium sp.]|jgi:Rod binding domain-containing protein|nr:rod-binding protein [Rhizomicrobium sp.]